MEKPVKGSIVIIPFSFSDLTNFKKRPDLVLTSLSGNDLILCQIKSKTLSDEFSILITDEDSKSGRLN